MGRRICQFGIEHGRCRCVCPDKVIPCDVPEKHGGAEALKKWGEPEFSAGGLADGERIDQLTAALDAAQDEIEKLISEKEALREQAMPSKERMMSAIHSVLHPACDQPDCIVDIYTAEDIVFAITGGTS